MNIIHVAGTKGKGSTCTYVESLLRAYGRRVGFPRKTGLYTSPHLVDVEERIRIDFRPLTKPLFAQYVFEVSDGLSLDSTTAGPRYLQMLALVSFHAFLREGVDVAIYETHHGGEYDATNVIPRPVVTAITTIGMDHVEQLGPSLENIAWHKAGIFKPGALAFSAPQEPAVARVLEQRAAEKGVALKFVEVDPDPPGELGADVQKVNFSLARQVSDAFLGLRAPGAPGTASLTREDAAEGIRQFRWPGRFQIIRSGAGVWFLDGAHNELSVGEAAVWFKDASSRMQGYAVRIPSGIGIRPVNSCAEITRPLRGFSSFPSCQASEMAKAFSVNWRSLSRYSSTT